MQQIISKGLSSLVQYSTILASTFSASLLRSASMLRLSESQVSRTHGPHNGYDEATICWTSLAHLQSLHDVEVLILYLGARELVFERFVHAFARVDLHPLGPNTTSSRFVFWYDGSHQVPLWSANTSSRTISKMFDCLVFPLNSSHPQHLICFLISLPTFPSCPLFTSTRC